MGNSLFENFPPAEIMKHLLTMSMVDGKDYRVEDDGGTKSFVAQDHGYLNREEGKPVTTGDPVIDAWERSLAAGVNPFDKDVQEVQGVNSGNR